MTVYVKVKATKPNDDTNRIAVSASYVKGMGAVVSAYPAHEKDGIVGLIIAAGVRHAVETMARDNKKKMEAIEEQVESHARLRLGSTWALVERLAKIRGLEILPEEE